MATDWKLKSDEEKTTSRPSVGRMRLRHDDMLRSHSLRPHVGVNTDHMRGS